MIFVFRITAAGRTAPAVGDSDPAARATRSSSKPAGGPETSALLSLMTLSSIVSVPSPATPPMPANCPFGSVATARLPLTTLRRSTSVAANRFVIPPALMPLASVPSVGVDRTCCS